MNYITLTIQIQRYANRSDKDFENAVPSFIAMGQERIWRELTGIEFEQVIFNGAMQMGTAIVQKPIDWNKTISLIYAPTNYSIQANILKPRTYEFCRAYWPNASLANSDNPPLFYSEHLESSFGISCFFISPTPDRAYKYELSYLKKVINISDSNTNNILTDYYPDLLFYACFLEALTYLRDDERTTVFEQNYQRALASARELTETRHTDRTSNRNMD